MKNKTQAHFFLFKRSGKLSLTDQETGEKGKKRDEKKWEQIPKRPHLYSNFYFVHSLLNTPKGSTLPPSTLSQMLILFLLFL